MESRVAGRRRSTAASSAYQTDRTDYAINCGHHTFGRRRLDPCAGSFVVLHAARELGREFLGCDLAYRGC